MLPRQLVLLLLPLPLKIVAVFVLAVYCCHVFQSCCGHCSVTVAAFASCCILCSRLLFWGRYRWVVAACHKLISFCRWLILGAFVSIALFGQRHRKG